MKFRISNRVTSILEAVHIARVNERAGNREARNKNASAIFANPKRRKVTYGGITVETWWDRHSKNWITKIIDAATQYELRDERGETIPASYNGNIDSAAVAHLWALYRLVDIRDKET